METKLDYQKPQVLLTRDGSYTVVSERFGATYHSVHGAINESNYVFIGQGLLSFIDQYNPTDISILEMGFGTGLNAYLSLLKAKQLNLKINYTTIEAYPVNPEIISALNYTDGHPDGDKAMFTRLHECSWNTEQELIPGFKFTKHCIRLEEFVSTRYFDLIYFDAFAPTDQPELWSEEIFKTLYKALNEGGFLVTYCAQGQMKRHLKAAGFSVKAVKGPPGKREMTVAVKL